MNEWTKFVAGLGTVTLIYILLKATESDEISAFWYVAAYGILSYGVGQLIGRRQL